MPASVTIAMKQFFVLLLGGLLLILVQVVPWHHMVPQAFRPNLSFALVIFLALYRPLISSWFLVFLLGYVLDVLSGVPSGFLPLINLLAFLFVRISCKYIVFESLPSQAALVFVVGFSLDLFLLISTGVALYCPPGLILKGVLTQSLLLAALSVPVFVVLNKKWGVKELGLK